MVIVETTVWVNYINGRFDAQTDWLDRNWSAEKLGITDLNFCEVLQGLKNEATFRGMQAELIELGVYPTGGADLALQSAKYFRELRARGITIRKTIDCLTATYCIREGHALLHSDRDYDPFEKYFGLKVIHPE